MGLCPCKYFKTGETYYDNEACEEPINPSSMIQNSKNYGSTDALANVDDKTSKTTTIADFNGLKPKQEHHRTVESTVESDGNVDNKGYTTYKFQTVIHIPDNLSSPEEFHDNPTESTKTPSILPDNSDIKCNKKRKIDSEEYNVVIIGQSGVGKSTLLNAMYNYLRFDTCYDALNGKFEHIIPTQFEVYDFETYEPITINTGYDKNENFNDVGSRTQTCKLHSMTYDNIKINFIDTPGLNDTRGLKQDERNLRNIKDMLQRFDKIHAICIVLKPNESVLTIPFKTSLEMLLSIFPNHVTQNIVFFMTYAHGTFFRPGDTVRPLKGLSEYLSDLRGMKLPEVRDDTFFCVDNEAFRYLCWIHQDRNVLNQGLFKDFEYSWIESKKSVLRFIERLKTIKPFDTCSLKNKSTNLLMRCGNNENSIKGSNFPIMAHY